MERKIEVTTINADWEDVHNTWNEEELHKLWDNNPFDLPSNDDEIASVKIDGKEIVDNMVLDEGSTFIELIHYLGWDNKIQIVYKREDMNRGVQLNDGRIIVVWDLKGKQVLNFAQPFNLETGEIYTEPNENTTDLNELIAAKKGKEVFPYESYDIDIKYDWKTLTPTRIARLKKQFAKKGYKVTTKALKYIFYAWRYGLKSGYRDQKNGYHLFCPYGDCNPLSFNLTTLVDSCKDWQKTYTC